MVVSHRVPNPAPARTSRLQPGAKPFTQPHRNRCFVNTRYDAASNRTWESMKVSGTQGPQVTLSYDAEQRLTSILRRTASGGASVTTNFSYDNGDRMTTITQSSSAAGALATYLYIYDAASQLSQYTGPEGTLTYSYDAASELSAVGDARTENYGYDLNGNRNATGYTTGADNMLSADGTFTYAYDAEGNQISKTRVLDGEQWTMTWDDRNRMTQDVEKTAGGVTVTNDVMTYDVENRRIGKSTNGTQVWFGYDGQNEYADFNNGGTLTERYLTGKALDSLYARFDGANTGWYLDDMLGSVRQVVNTGGTVLDALTYDSYGQILSDTNSANGDRFKYTSREWDSEVGLQFNRARYYDPQIGRWISNDPLSFSAHDTNLTRYVTDDPLVHADPLGLAGLWYGQYCGPGKPQLQEPWGGKLDQCCKDHDDAYDRISKDQKAGKIRLKEAMKRRDQANIVLCKCALHVESEAWNTYQPYYRLGLLAYMCSAYLVAKE